MSSSLSITAEQLSVRTTENEEQRNQRLDDSLMNSFHVQKQGMILAMPAHSVAGSLKTDKKCDCKVLSKEKRY